MTPDRISACIICCNEERKIERCLRSVTWCDEIVVVDSFSTDRTVEICRRYTDRVFQHEWMGYVGQRNHIRDLARNPWLLFLDSDEEVSPGLRDEIQREFRVSPPRCHGYEFPRMVYYLGRWIRHGEWYPDVKLRLFHRDHGRSEGQEPHDRVVVDGAVGRLRNPLWHYTYDDISDHLKTVNRFSTITARQHFIAEEPFEWSHVLVRPFLRFLKGYIIKRGFLDGAHGFLIAGISAYGVFVKYAKLWELEQRSEAGYREEPVRDVASA